MSLTSNHIPFAKLVDLAEGRILRDTPGEHLARCPDCAARLTQLEGLLNTMRQDALEDAPPSLVARAVALFRALSTEAAPSLMRRIVAALRFDSLQMSPAYGVRSSGQTGARQLLYSAGENDLDLRLSQSDEAWVISGQVLGPDCMSAEIELKGETSEAQRAVLNDQCEFRLSPVPPGSYSLRLRLVDREVEIPQLELRA
jgi:hypothetical protein